MEQELVWRRRDTAGERKGTWGSTRRDLRAVGVRRVRGAFSAVPNPKVKARAVICKDW